MKKLIALAALAGGMFAAPAPLLAASDIPAHCVLFPLLKAECRAAINDAGEAAAAGEATLVGSAVDTAERVSILPLWWECERSTDGKTLFTCSDTN